jgi:hypothetical protein
MIDRVDHMINLHVWGAEFVPRAHVAVPGSLDLCLVEISVYEQ